MSAHHRPILTFGRRRNRPLREAKQRLMDELLPKLQFSVEEKLQSPLYLEIGFGGGEHLAAQAIANPGIQFLGCEPFVNGIANLLSLIEHNHANVRLWPDDARPLVDALPDACVDRAFILFPDPWPKARHHKRRLIQLEFLEKLARIMKPGAELRIATDHVDYLAWMLSHLLASPHFAWTAQCAEDWLTPPADWVRTGYQDWAEKEGRVSTYLQFRRI